MELIIKDRKINGEIKTILNKLKIDSHKTDLLNSIEALNDTDLSLQCPFHANGKERHNSATIVKIRNDPKLQFGYFNCFTCKCSYSLPQLVTKFFDSEDTELGEEWLLQNFGGERANNQLLPEINLNAKEEDRVIDESILLNYDFYHPYLWKRKLNKLIVDRFRVGYDKSRNAITFPVWDEKNNLKMVTARSVKTKTFYIQKDADKGKLLYLLNFAIQDKVPMVGITEAQIDALTSWGYGFPCVATFGSPTKDQIKLLVKSGIRVIVTMFDNDEAGSNFTTIVNRNLPKSVMVINLNLPKSKKDINDLTQEEFDNCLKSQGISWRLF